MGESLVETPTVEEKMSETVAHVPCLQESVSFGRFEHDSLYWERWSTFPSNKYLEEVEKCSTPGSVAQKKAYFEAHYKRVAALKAEQDQEKKRESELLGTEDQSQNLMDSVRNSSKVELEVEQSNTYNTGYRTALENRVSDFVEEVIDVHIDAPGDEVSIVDEENGESDEHIDVLYDDTNNVEGEMGNFGNEVSDEHIDVFCDGTNNVQESKMSYFGTEVSELIDESNGGAEAIKEKDLLPQPELATEEFRPDESEFVKDDIASRSICQDKEVDIESPQEIKVDEREISKKETTDLVRIETPRKMEKVTTKTIKSTNTMKKTPTPMLKGSAARMPKKSAASMPKSSALSAPKLSKPLQSKTLMSTTNSSVKKENGFTPLSTKKAARPEGKRIAPTSLHMSLSLGSANSDPAAPMTTRKSLIMESMGDKDIVKRAFKAFENRNLLSSQSPITNQSAGKRSEQKGCGSVTLQKKNGGNSRSVKPASPASQQGTVRASPSPGLRKTIGVEQKIGRSIPSSFSSRSLNLGNKQKEKLEPKSMTREIGKVQRPSKVMSQKTEIKRTNQSSNAKVNLSRSLNQGRVSKPLSKEDVTTKTSG